jgi:hypothetical protein
MRNPLPTVLISDGRGGVTVINEVDYNPQVHVLFVDSKQSKATKTTKKPEPVGESNDERD